MPTGWWRWPKRMKEVFKKYFIPHAENNYQPHILHTKRAIFYSASFLVMKTIVILFALLLPAEAFLLPDVLANQYAKIIILTNAIRIEKGVLPLSVVPKLNSSAETKARDMGENQYFSHHGPNNRGLAYFLRQAGYRYRMAGENLAMGFFDAEAVVDAWVKSPTHYSNLIDNDFRELGVSLESGLYQNQPTMYVVQHFGDPLSDMSNGGSKSNGQKAEARGEKIYQVGEAISPKDTLLDRPASRVYWLEEDGSTVLVVRARFREKITSAAAYVNNYPIELTRSANNEYAGSLTVAGPADSFFRSVVAPAIIITTRGGEKIQDTIDWYNIKAVNENPIERYFEAKSMLAPLTSLFKVSRGLYLGFTVFFLVALAINILIEVRKRHYHIIAQTILMLGLLAWLIKY